MVVHFRDSFSPGYLHVRVYFGSGYTAKNDYSYLKQAFQLQGINKYSYKSEKKDKGRKSLQVAYKIDSVTARNRELGGLAKGYTQFDVTASL